MNKNRNLTYATLVVMIAVIAIIVVRACTGPTSPVTLIPPEGPSVPTEGKPSLAFSRPVPGAAAVWKISGYTSPSGSPILMKVGPFKNLQDQPYGPPEQYGGRTPVALVEIGTAAPGSETQQPAPGVYLLTIDLASKGPRVAGQLFPVNTASTPTATSTPITATSTTITETGTPFIETGTPVAGPTLEITFQRIPQILNPARTDSPYDEFKALKPPPDIDATISADRMCFVVNTAGATNENPVYISYCSQPSVPGQPPSPLSVMDNFTTQYRDLQTLINTAVDRLKRQGYLEPEANIQPNQIISEKEDAQRLRDCAEAEQAGQAQAGVQQVCSSDIVVAPVEEGYFQRKLDEARSQSILPGSRFMLASLLAPAFQENNRFSILAGVVRIVQPIQTPNGTFLQGDYSVYHWYDIIDGKEIFYAVTITGLTTDNTPVTNLQITASPSAHSNENPSDPPPPRAQVSGTLVWGVCWWFECVPPS